MEHLTRYFYNLLISNGVPNNIAEYLNAFIGTVILGFTLYIIDILTKKVLLGIFKSFATKSRNTFDDYLLKNKAVDNIAHAIPLIIITWAIPKTYSAFPKIVESLEFIDTIMFIILTILILRSFLRTLRDFLKSLKSFKDKPIDSYIQVFMIFVWAVGIISIISLITGKSILTFLTALGAMSAVILLIFKDTILGFVASIQVAVNDTVRIGDWITMEKFGADGDIIEINLSSVKVQNFDKTITSIPTYFLNSETFKNWRGMKDSGGRRIKRAVLIKATSIKFLSDDEIEKLKKIEYLKDYLTNAQKEINAYNQKLGINKSALINGRNLSNIGVFRQYVQSYLENHPHINQEMTIMTRQLSPTEKGTPLEIYAFSNDKEWKNYEIIVSDIFDHILSSITYFKLEVFELDYSNIKMVLTENMKENKKEIELV